MASENYQRWRETQRERQQRKKGWTGFKDKTLWDWLQLLAAFAIPVVIAVGGWWFASSQSQASDRASAQQHQTDLQIANDQQQEAALQSYLDHMSDLLLNYHLKTSKPGDEVREVARSRTLTLLPQLNGTRKAKVVLFLYEANLIKTNDTIVSLDGADLTYAQLSFAHLEEANLSGTILEFANLSDANLTNASLFRARLFRAKLYHTVLYNTDLRFASLKQTNVTPQQLKETTLLQGISLSQ